MAEPFRAQLTTKIDTSILFLWSARLKKPTFIYLGGSPLLRPTSRLMWQLSARALRYPHRFISKDNTLMKSFLTLYNEFANEKKKRRPGNTLKAGIHPGRQAALRMLCYSWKASYIKCCGTYSDYLCLCIVPDDIKGSADRYHSSCCLLFVL